jgi:hypothetical protein
MATPASTKKGKRSQAWDESFKHLKSFHDEHGHCRVPSSTPLWKFVVGQRSQRTKLSPEKIQRLDEVNMDWESNTARFERQWNDMFDRLKIFRKQHGHTRVPQKYAENPQLGTWITNQQGAYRNRKLSSERETRLESIGFEWLRDERLVWKEDRPLGKTDDLWTRKFNELKAFEREHGHTLVPPKHKVLDDEGERDEYDLGMWANKQRRAFREGVMRKGRKERLETIGFVFTIDYQDLKSSLQQRNWDEMFHRLLDFQKTHGHCQVPIRYKADTQLGIWVRYQRSRHTRGEMHESLFERLDAEGFIWEAYEHHWNNMVHHLTAYRDVYGHCRVPDGYVAEDGAHLGMWCRTVKSIRNGTLPKAKLSPERIAELDSLNFVWNINKPIKRKRAQCQTLTEGGNIKHVHASTLIL